VAGGRAPRDCAPGRDGRPAAPAGRSAVPGGGARSRRTAARVAAAPLESRRDHRERVGVAPSGTARVRELRRVDSVLLLQVGRAVPTTPWELVLTSSRDTKFVLAILVVFSVVSWYLIFLK